MSNLLHICMVLTRQRVCIECSRCRYEPKRPLGVLGLHVLVIRFTFTSSFSHPLHCQWVRVFVCSLRVSLSPGCLFPEAVPRFFYGTLIDRARVRRFLVDFPALFFHKQFVGAGTDFQRRLS